MKNTPTTKVVYYPDIMSSKSRFVWTRHPTLMYKNSVQVVNKSYDLIIKKPKTFLCTKASVHPDNGFYDMIVNMPF